MVRGVVTASLTCVLMSGIARAQPATADRELAREHYRKATIAYNLGKYLDAAREYESTYEITMDAAMLFNIGQAYRLAGEREKAITAYRSYLRNVPESPRREFIEQKVRELEQQKGQPAAPVVKTEWDDPFTMNDSPPATAPSPPPAIRAVAPTPPPATISAPLTVESQPAPSQPPFYRRWPFIVGASAAVIVGVVAVVLVTSGQGGLSMPANDYGTRRF